MTLRFEKVLSWGLLAGLLACTTRPAPVSSPNLAVMASSPTLADTDDHKIIVYQMMTRLFGNTKTTNKAYGTLAENGVGKFNDITGKALDELRALGTTHVWYTGVLEHATLTDYSAYGIPLDDADVVKGRAGSPYAIKDYYDVNPDLAVDVKNRRQEFEALIARTHYAGLGVLIDFVPNHVARRYHSDAKPAGVKDLGEADDVNQAFSPRNNFYYLPGTSFQVPAGYQSLGNLPHPTKDGKFAETPAKVTGNDQFTASPGVNEWFETVKLNYGVDIQNGRTKHFEPVPDTWLKMRDILLYWADKGVDGFRCDMAEMVPVEFWGWAIPQVRAVKPNIIFIAEIYNPAEYRNYLEKGQFTYLYDKVDLYDTLKAVVQGRAEAQEIRVVTDRLAGLHSRMLRFLENHDEQRLASPYFAGSAQPGFPAMGVTALVGSGPVLVYFGQEVGEPGAGAEGFGGDDGRTTIFDYWGIPEHQKWLNGGKFDGGGLSDSQRELRLSYAALLNFARQQEAVRKGKLLVLPANPREGYLELANRTRVNGATPQRVLSNPAKTFAFVRHTATERLLVVCNFSANREQLSFRPGPEMLQQLGLGQKEPVFYRVLRIYQGWSAVKIKEAPQTAELNRELPPYSVQVFSF